MPGQMIFLDEKDFADFLGVLSWVVKRDHFLLQAYCLMNNHYHLLIGTIETRPIFLKSGLNPEGLKI